MCVCVWLCVTGRERESCLVAVATALGGERHRQQRFTHSCKNIIIISSRAVVMVTCLPTSSDITSCAEAGKQGKHQRLKHHHSYKNKSGLVTSTDLNCKKQKNQRVTKKATDSDHNSILFILVYTVLIRCEKQKTKSTT